MRFSDYDPFAFIYNQQWGDFAIRALPILEELALSHLPANASILDVCCGTGQLAAALSRRGYRVTGIDGSTEMLRYARRNAPTSEFLLADARTFQLPPRFHAAFSTYDSLNHLLTLPDLTQAYECVAAALRPGGLFVFDLNTEEGYLAHWRASFGILEDEYACIVQSRFDQPSQTGTFGITMFFREPDEGVSWTRHDLTLTQRCYTPEEVTAALEKTGFTSIETLYPQGPGRAFFKAVKS